MEETENMILKEKKSNLPCDDINKNEQMAIDESSDDNSIGVDGG